MNSYLEGYMSKDASWWDRSKEWAGRKWYGDEAVDWHLHGRIPRSIGAPVGNVLEGVAGSLKGPARGLLQSRFTGNKAPTRHAGMVSAGVTQDMASQYGGGQQNQGGGGGGGWGTGLGLAGLAAGGLGAMALRGGGQQEQAGSSLTDTALNAYMGYSASKLGYKGLTKVYPWVASKAGAVKGGVGTAAGAVKGGLGTAAGAVKGGVGTAAGAVKGGLGTAAGAVKGGVGTTLKWGGAALGGTAAIPLAAVAGSAGIGAKLIQDAPQATRGMREMIMDNEKPRHAPLPKAEKATSEELEAMNSYVPGKYDAPSSPVSPPKLGPPHSQVDDGMVDTVGKWGAPSEWSEEDDKMFQDGYRTG